MWGINFQIGDTDMIYVLELFSIMDEKLSGLEKILIFQEDKSNFTELEI